MAVLRDRDPADGPVGADELAAVWPDGAQRDRALATLLADGLLIEDAGSYRLP